MASDKTMLMLFGSGWGQTNVVWVDFSPNLSYTYHHSYKLICVAWIRITFQTSRSAI